MTREEFIKKKIKEKGMTLKDYARMINMPYSTLLSMLREVALGVGLALLLPLKWGLDGVLYSMPAADALTFVASLAVICLTYRELTPVKTR